MALLSLHPVDVFTVRHSIPDDEDIGQKLAILQHHEGYKLCVIRSRTKSYVSVTQHFFSSVVEAKRYAQQHYNCAGRFEV